MTQQNVNNSEFTDSGYLEPKNTTGNTYGNLSYIESKRNLASAERSTKLGKLDEAKSYLDEFTKISGIHHAELQKGWLGSTKPKENMAMIRELSDSHNIATINRYRDEALRRGQYLSAEQLIKLFNKSRQASNSVESALETSNFLEETLSKMTRSDSVDGLTDITLSKLDEIRINNSANTSQIEQNIIDRIKTLDKNNWSFYAADKTKDYVAGVVSNITGMLDLTGDLYSFVSGQENPVKATALLANLMGVDTNSKTYYAGMFSGFAMLSPITAAANAAKAATTMPKLEAALISLRQYANATKAGLHAIETGLTLGAMHYAGKGASQLIEQTNINENRKKSLPNLISAAAGVGAHFAIGKIRNTYIKNSSKPGEGIATELNDIYGEGEVPASNNKTSESNAAKETEIHGLPPETVESLLEQNQEASKIDTPTEIAEVSEASKEDIIRQEQKIRQATITEGENYEGAVVVDNEIAGLTPENVEKGARNTANYNREISNNGKFKDIESSIETDAMVLNDKSIELARAIADPAIVELQRGIVVQDGKVSGLEKPMQEILEGIKKMTPTKSIARLAEQGGILTSDILMAQAQVLKPHNPMLAHEIINVANVMEGAIGYKSTLLTPEGIAANDLLRDIDAARTRVFLSTSEITKDTLNTINVKDAEQTNTITREGINDLNRQIADEFSKKYEEIDSTNDTYLRENPEELLEIKKDIIQNIKQLETPTEPDVNGQVGYEYKSIINKIASKGGLTDQSVVKFLVEKIENDGKIRGQSEAIRDVQRLLNNGITENKTIEQSGKTKFGISSTYKANITNPISSIIDSMYRNSLGDMALYEQLKSEYASYAQDRSALKINKYSTEPNAQYNLVSKSPNLWTKLKKHLKGAKIDPKSPAAIFEQLIKYRILEPMADISLSGDISVGNKNIVKEMSKRRHLIESIYSEEKYADLVELAEHIEASRQRKLLLEKLDTSKITEEYINEQINNLKEKTPLSETFGTIKNTIKGAKMFIPIKSVWKFYMGSKLTLAGIEAVSSKLAHAHASKIMNQALAYEATPQIKALNTKHLATNIIKNNGYAKTNTRG